MSRRGKIYTVACTDFVTYDQVIVFPHEYLNIIIGPNGTGKSTLVAAIVLCMGGRPEILSRSSALKDWIKHGCDEAKIEVHIFNNEEGHTTAFQRRFNVTGMDIFKIDEKEFSRKQFLKQVKEFNIQVENLCQFLPQDRVQDFAKMNAQELFANTQLSVCSDEVQGQFRSLRDLRQKQMDIGKDDQLRQKEMEDLQAKNEAVRPQIENIQARGGLVNELEIGKKKLAWMDYDKWNEKVKQYTQDLNQGQAKLAEAEGQMATVKAESKGITTLKQKMETQITADRASERKLNQDLHKQHEQLSALTQEIRTTKQKFQDAIAQARENKDKITDANTLLAALTQDFANLTRNHDAAETNAKIKELTNKHRAASEQKEQLMNKRVELRDESSEIRMKIDRIKNRVVNMENEERRKLEALKNRDAATYEATMWLKENRHMFKGHIYDPVILELQLKKQGYAKFLEKSIAFRDFHSFGCEDVDDVEVFLHEMRVKRKLGVNAYHAESADHLQFRPTYPLDQMRRYGFETYLIDTIGGPAPVLNFLCKIYHIHQVPICNESVESKVDSLPNEIRVFYTPTKCFRINISRYSGAKSTSVVDVQGRNWLDDSVDPAVLNEHKHKLKEFMQLNELKCNEITRLEGQIQHLEETVLSQVKNEKLAIQNSMTSLKVAADKVKRQKEKVQQLQNTIIDIHAERAKMKQHITPIVANMIRVHENINKSLQGYAKAQISVELQQRKLELFRRENSQIEGKLFALEEKVKGAKQITKKIQEHVNNAQHEAKIKEKEAMKLTDNKKPSDRNFQYKEAFAKLPSGIDELTNVLTDLQARIDCIGAVDQTLIDEFEERKAKIESLLGEIRSTKNKSAALQTKIEETHRSWYAEVKGIVDTINNNFSRFMSSMNLAGEVELTHQDEYSYSDYGITIRVKYRASDKLAVLDRTYQSGGERAVAIAVYSLSLQQLSHVPFRCVDEINQGMDAKNERKIFEMLLNETCKVGQSQYFFITPKLLPNLPSNDLMNLLVVHNGKFVDDPFCFVKEQIQ